MRISTRKSENNKVASVEHYIDDDYEAYLDFLEEVSSRLQSLISKRLTLQGEVVSIKVQSNLHKGIAVSYSRSPAIDVGISSLQPATAKAELNDVIALVQPIVEQAVKDFNYNYKTTWVVKVFNADTANYRWIDSYFVTGEEERKAHYSTGGNLYKFLLTLQTHDIFSSRQSTDRISYSDIGNPDTVQYSLVSTTMTESDFENILIKFFYNSDYDLGLVEQVRQVVYDYFYDLLSLKGLTGELVINFTMIFKDKNKHISHITLDLE